jgi:hypothetical protein
MKVERTVSWNDLYCTASSLNVNCPVYFPPWQPNKYIYPMKRMLVFHVKSSKHLREHFFTDGRKGVEIA